MSVCPGNQLSVQPLLVSVVTLYQCRMHVIGATHANKPNIQYIATSMSRLSRHCTHTPSTIVLTETDRYCQNNVGRIKKGKIQRETDSSRGTYYYIK
ncbi:hypothetical protein FKM82_008479 [Ascaphus truei]